MLVASLHSQFDLTGGTTSGSGMGERDVTPCTGLLVRTQGCFACCPCCFDSRFARRFPLAVFEEGRSANLGPTSTDGMVLGVPSQSAWSKHDHL